jgi:regulator of protease activity HflC (stomatin/prohibitin superfamily)
MTKLKTITLSLIALLLMVSCETVPSGHKGVEVSWGGETNLNIIHPEGMVTGFQWLFDDMVAYDVREKTIVQKFEFNDKNNMITLVELSLDYRLAPTKVNLLHTQISDVQTKIIKTLKSAGKEVVPQYSAIELNITKRNEAEELLAKIINEELPEFYVEFARLQMTDVDIPASVAKLAEETAIQLGRNELALKKEAEQVALAQADIAKSKGAAEAQTARAKGEYEAAIYDAKTKDILSQPKMLKLLELEVEMKWAEKGISKYGTNNIFGSQTAVVKGLR